MTQATLSPDDAAAHIYPSDLDRFKFGEHTGTAFSIAVGCPDETSVPLFTTDQAEAYAAARIQEILHEEAKPDNIKRAEYYGEGHGDGWKAGLEQAAREAKRVSDKYAYGHYGNEVDTADEIEAAIRALIPKS